MATSPGPRSPKAPCAAPVALDYAAATAAIADPAHPQHEVLRDAHDVAHVLLASRREHGALVLYDLSQGLVSDGDGGLLRLNTGERHSAYVVVAELMVAANRTIAEFAAARDVAILFRNHQAAATAPPREQLLEELRLLGSGEAWRREATAQRLVHALRPAFYAPHAGEHYGLRLPFYTHATSPLRRYADLLVQRQLLAVLRGQTPPHDGDELARHAQAINTTLARARQRRDARHEGARRDERRATLAEGEFGELPAEAFHKVVKLAVSENRHGQALEAEVCHRTVDGRVQAGTAHHILLVADQPWHEARRALLSWLTAHPEYAVFILAMHARRCGMHTPHWDERPVGTTRQPLFSARAGLTIDGPTTWSAPRIHRGKNLARQQAALSLIATLAQTEDPSTTLDTPAAARASSANPLAGPNPAMAVNELAQRGVLTGLGYAFTTTGPSHAPTFTCTVRARHEPTATALTGSGTGTTKAAAKTTAARDLHTQLTAATSP